MEFGGLPGFIVTARELTLWNAKPPILRVARRIGICIGGSGFSPPYKFKKLGLHEGREVTFIPCDVTNGAAVEAAVSKTVSLYGALHILINNAGGGAREMFPEESDETWDRVLRVNLTACFLTCRAAWPHLIKSGSGAIVNVSSLAAVSGASPAVLEKFPALPSSSYYAAKAGLEGFTRYTASVGAPHNIRVNCVRPGQVLTKRLTTAAKEHVFARHFEIWQLLKGPGHAEDIANAMLFLASDEARFITAEIVNIDGGAAAKLE